MRSRVAKSLGLPWSSVRVIKPYMGGGFGNKQDVLEEPMAAFLSYKLGGVPVKVTLSREECFFASRTRHGFAIDGTLGINRDGTLKGYQLNVLSNTGGYASHGHSIASAGANKISYLYPRSALAMTPKPSTATCPPPVPCAATARPRWCLPSNACWMTPAPSWDWIRLRYASPTWRARGCQSGQPEDHLQRRAP